MVRTILVPLNGSPFSEHALLLACRIAQCAKATLRLVHVYMHSPVPIYVAGKPPIDADATALRWEQERNTLQHSKERLQRVHGPELNIVIDLVDRPLESTVNEPLGSFLAAYAAQHQVDLIVMSSHGRGGLARFWLGSVADALIRTSAAPVLLVRPTDGGANEQQATSMKKILIPLDGSALAEKVLTPARELGALLGSKFLLLRVIEPTTLAGGRPVGVREARAYLREMALRLGVDQRLIQTRVIAANRPARTILEIAEQSGSDLIALATQGQGGLKRLWIGSVADKVLRGAKTPVLIYRPPESTE